MKTHFITYATPNFFPQFQFLKRTLGYYGFEKITCFTPTDLQKTVFYTQNKTILDQERGAGYWLWKPYFIYETLKQVEENDIVFYVDAAFVFLDSPQRLINIVENNSTGSMIFSNYPLKNSEWTKRDAFVKMQADEEKFWNGHQVVAGFNLFKKNDFTLRFVKEWLENSCQEDILTDLPNACGLPNLPDFRDHRHDQSVLSILVKKYDLETYRYPTQWGNFLKMPEFRVQGEYVGYPYRLNDSIKEYDPNPCTNSPYGTLVESNVKPDQTWKLIIFNEIRFGNPILGFWKALQMGWGENKFFEYLRNALYWYKWRIKQKYETFHHHSHF